MIEAIKYNFSNYMEKFLFTINAMAEMVKDFKINPKIRQIALSIIMTAPERDAMAETQTIFNWVRDTIKYRKDIAGVETLQTPIQTIQFRSGDCDDQVILLNALLESVGIKTRFVVIAQKRRGVWNHIYSQALIGRDFYDMDPIRDVDFGEGPEKYIERRFFLYD